MHLTTEDTTRAMEQYLLTFLIGHASVSATKCSQYEGMAKSPDVKKFFKEQRSMLDTTIKRLRNLLEPTRELTAPPASLTDLDMLLDWHKDVIASGGTYFAASFQVPSEKLEQEFAKQAAASKITDRTTRNLIIKMGGSVL